ncbi:hypothetical protein I79_002352 [Cricetulus griseus]|uniref:Uncharacterized protein n=1 Tax=Cricetulus griseus TaxID=10029 RepID=G3GX40_CRIGR|nr:hypothetical protein I79_002352 [Cricetulus griseus]
MWPPGWLLECCGLRSDTERVMGNIHFAVLRASNCTGDQDADNTPTVTFKGRG